MNKRRLAIPLILALLALSVGGYFYVKKSTSSTERGQILLEGNVETREVSLAFNVGGRIKRLLADEGDSVAPGQPLAILDPSYLDDAVAEARARRGAAAANLAKLVAGNRREDVLQARALVAQRAAAADLARRELARAAAGVPAGVVARQQYDEALAAKRQADAALEQASQGLALQARGSRPEDIETARSEVAQADAALQKALRARADATLSAPQHGIVRTRARETGAIVGPTETVFTLALVRPVWIRTYASEADLPRLRPGMVALVRTDAGKTYRGRVGFVSPTAEFTPKTVETRELRTDLVYRLRILVDVEDAGLRQGMPVSVALDPSAAPRR